MLDRIVAGISVQEALERFVACCNTRETLFITPSWIEPRTRRLRELLSDPITDAQAAALRRAILKQEHLDTVIGWLKQEGISLDEHVQLERRKGEIALINHVLLGDPGAADAFVEKYSRLVFHILREDFSIFDQQDVNDVHQLVFQRLWSNNCAALRRWQGNNFVAYLRVIVANLARDFIRIHGRRPTDLPDRPERDPQIRELITAVLDRLSERDKRLITLRHVEGYSHQEIAGELGLTLNAAGVALCRAEARFRQILCGEYREIFRDLCDV